MNSGDPTTIRRWAWRAAMVSVLMLNACAAWSNDQGDPVARFINERGLVANAQPATGQLDQWRDRASELVVGALHFVGVPYRWGGDSVEEGFDCSGFTRHVFEMSLGRRLPRRADEQALQAGLSEVAATELRAGDLVFFNTLRRPYSHVGIYVGEGRFIHAPRRGALVRMEDMRVDYWRQRYNGARRAPQSWTSQVQTAQAPRR
jgi:cell wall-associated NlpC family hydrolase